MADKGEIQGAGAKEEGVGRGGGGSSRRVLIIRRLLKGCIIFEGKYNICSYDMVGYLFKYL